MSGGRRTLARAGVFLLITAGGGWRGRGGGEWKAIGQRSIFVNYGRWAGVGLRRRNPAGEGWRERAGGGRGWRPLWANEVFLLIRGGRL